MFALRSTSLQFKPAQMIMSAQSQPTNQANWLTLNNMVAVNDATYTSSVENDTTLVVLAGKVGATLSISVPWTSSASYNGHSARVLKNGVEVLNGNNPAAPVTSGTITASGAVDVVASDRLELQFAQSLNYSSSQASAGSWLKVE